VKMRIIPTLRPRRPRLIFSPIPTYDWAGICWTT